MASTPAPAGRRSINARVGRTRLSPATAKCPSQSILPDASSFPLHPTSSLPVFQSPAPAAGIDGRAQPLLRQR
jgi:hypothetical protein